MLKLISIFMVLLSVNAYSLMRFEVEKIKNPYAQGWPEEKVIHEDSLNLFHASNVRVNKIGYNTNSTFKRAFVYNHKKGDAFEVINAKTGLVEYKGDLTEATDINGSPVSTSSEGNLTCNFYFDASVVPKRIVSGYPKMNEKTGTESIHVADFSDIDNGFYFVVCGDDTSTTFEVGEYVLNKLSSLQTMFLGFQRCGGESWSHLDCHVRDGDAIGEAGCLKGGWHDCGDHIKVGQNVGFTAMMVSFISVIGQDKVLDMFNGDYTDTLITDGIPDHLREAEWGARYIMKLYRMSKKNGIFSEGKMYTGVGNGQKDHNFWDLPSIQDSESEENGGAPRKIHTNVAADIYGSYIAALGFFASEWRKGYGEAFADSCLEAADEIYAIARTLGKPKWEFDGLYSGNGYHCDEMGLAAIAMAYAHKEKGDTEGAKLYIDDLMYNTKLGETSSSDIDWGADKFPAGWLSAQADGTSTFLSGEGMIDWQNVAEIGLYALLKLMVKDEATAKSYKHDRLTKSGEKFDYKFFRETACDLFSYVVDGGTDLIGHEAKVFGFNPIKPTIAHAPYNLTDPKKDWGWNRYMMGKAIIPFLFGEYLATNYEGNNEALAPYKNYIKWYDWGIETTNYLCGMNPWDISFIVGAGEKFPHHVHNRTACAENANTGSLPYNFIPPYGALAPWIAPGGNMIEDITEDGLAGQGFKLTETCVDYSMAVSLAMVTASVAKPEDTDAPLIKDINYIQIGPDEFYFSWNTDELANSELYWMETNSPTKDKLLGANQEKPFPNPTDISGMKKFNELTIDGLKKNTTYFFLIKSTDRFGNVAYAENEIKGVKNYYKFTLEDMQDAKIENLMICPKDEHTVQVAWWTDVPSNSVVDYWEKGDKEGTKKTVTRDDNALITNFHVVTIKDLKASTEYDFIAKSSNDSRDSSFVTDFAFARFTMSSGRSTGAPPEFLVFLQNADYDYNQSYDGIKVRIYLDYPAGWFTGDHPEAMHNDRIELTDWGVKNQGTKGHKNLTAEYAVGGRVRDKLKYKTDEEGYTYVEVDMPSTKEILADNPTFKYSATLDPGGWMYFRLKLYSCSNDDEEITDAWSVKSHSYPVEQGDMYIHPTTEFKGDDRHFLTPQAYMGVYQTDENGKERHLYGYTPSTNLYDPGFHQNYEMKLSLSEPVQTPPETNFTIYGDDDIRMLELKGVAECVGERLGHGNISKLMINKTEVNVPQPNGGIVNFKYDFPLEDGTNIVNIIALDSVNCAFNNLTLTINSVQSDATPSTLTVLKQDAVTETKDAELDKEKLFIKVKDLDENKLIDRKEKITALIVNSIVGDTEEVICEETDVNSGEFMSITSIPVTSIGYSGDGAISGNSGDIAHAIYQDPSSKSDISIVSIVLYSEKAGVRFADSSFTPLVEDKKKKFDIENDSIFVRLVDFNNQSKNSLDFKIFSATTGDVVKATAKKLDASSKVHSYGFGALPFEISATPLADDNILSISLMDRIIAEYTDPNDAGDIARDTLVLNASFKKIFLSWGESLKDTIPHIFDTTTVYTTDKEFTIYSLGLKDDNSVQKARIKWNFYETVNHPFQFYKNNPAKDTMMTITLTGESEGVGFMSGSYELDPNVPVRESGIIKVVDPIDRIFLIEKEALEDGLTMSDTNYVVKDTIKMYLGLPTDVALVGIDDDAGKIYEIGGFWTIERGGSSIVIDSTYSGVYPPRIDLNDIKFLGTGQLKVVYSTIKGLIENVPVQILDPVDKITVYSSSFSSRDSSNYYGLNKLHINDVVYEGDTINIDKNTNLQTLLVSEWVRLVERSNSSTSSIVIDSIFGASVDWNLEELKDGNFRTEDFRDSLVLDEEIGKMYEVTAKRNDNVKFSFIIHFVDKIEFGFAPNPVTKEMLLNGIGKLQLTVDDSTLSKVEAEVYDINGYLIHRYKTWENKNKDLSGKSGDFIISRAEGTKFYNFETIAGAWDGKSNSGAEVSSGVYFVVLRTYSNGNDNKKSYKEPFYIINKK